MTSGKLKAIIAVFLQAMPLVFTYVIYSKINVGT